MQNLNNEIKSAIDSFDVERARILLRDALKEPNAETYYLASLVAINDGQKVEFLKKALQLDSSYTKAGIALDKLTHPPQFAVAPSYVPVTQMQVPGMSAEDFEKSLARQKSYIGPAIVTFILTLLFWIPGLIANILYLREARKVQSRAGQKLTGVGCLWALLMLNTIIPFAIVIIFIGSSVNTSTVISATASAVQLYYATVDANETQSANADATGLACNIAYNTELESNASEATLSAFYQNCLHGNK